MTMSNYRPVPVFDTLEHACELFRQCQTGSDRKIVTAWLKQCLQENAKNIPSFISREFYLALCFLHSYRGSVDTFNAYRREIERFTQWSWFVHKKSVLELRRTDIEMFIEFCQDPPKRWIGLKNVSRFTNKNGGRFLNPEWRPFVARVSKRAFQHGEMPEKAMFELSQSGISQLFAILGTFYNFLIQEEVTEINPVAQIRQKSKFIQKQSQKTIRRLSDLQWQTVLGTARRMADETPERHERTFFIMQVLYGMYLRVSELAASERWQPKMGDFFRDANEDWWFKTVGKGNKMRQVAVSPPVLDALKRYRKYLGYPALPSPDEQEPLVTKEKGSGPVSSPRVIRAIVQRCFDAAVAELIDRDKIEDAEILRSATVHWLRHTGISDDVKFRPREHVRDDAGHSSSAITDRYIDVELQERARTAKRKRKAEIH